MVKRCDWCPADDSLYVAYHDTEWGVPVRDERLLFEFLLLEGAQAGLSWRTILGRREGYRAVFYGFDPKRIAAMTEAEMEAARNDERIIRNRLKIKAFVTNARAFLRMRDEGVDFSEYLWSFVGGSPVVNGWRTMRELPAKTPIAEAMSKMLKKRGFTFVGPTICYAFMQACGMVNDHIVDCFRHREVQALE